MKVSFSPLDPSFKGIGEVYPLGLEITDSMDRQRLRLKFMCNRIVSAKKGKSLTGFTLIEIIVTMVLISILASLAIPTYINLQERTLVREAQVALKLIRSGQLIYSGEYSEYFGPEGDFGDGSNPGDPGAGNKYLNIALDDGGTNPNWDYDIITIGTSPSSFVATASRTGGYYSTCVYQIDDASREPAVYSGTCPDVKFQ